MTAPVTQFVTDFSTQADQSPLAGQFTTSDLISAAGYPFCDAALGRFCTPGSDGAGRTFYRNTASSPTFLQLRAISVTISGTGTAADGVHAPAGYWQGDAGAGSYWSNGAWFLFFNTANAQWYLDPTLGNSTAPAYLGTASDYFWPWDPSIAWSRDGNGNSPAISQIPGTLYWVTENALDAAINVVTTATVNGSTAGTPPAPDDASWGGFMAISGYPAPTLTASGVLNGMNDLITGQVVLDGNQGPADSLSLYAMQASGPDACCCGADVQVLGSSGASYLLLHTRRVDVNNYCYAVVSFGAGVAMIYDVIHGTHYENGHVSVDVSGGFHNFLLDAAGRIASFFLDATEIYPVLTAHTTGTGMGFELIAGSGDQAICRAWYGGRLGAATPAPTPPPTGLPVLERVMQSIVARISPLIGDGVLSAVNRPLRYGEQKTWKDRQADVILMDGVTYDPLNAESKSFPTEGFIAWHRRVLVYFWRRLSERSADPVDAALTEGVARILGEMTDLERPFTDPTFYVDVEEDIPVTSPDRSCDGRMIVFRIVFEHRAGDAYSQT